MPYEILRSQFNSDVDKCKSTIYYKKLFQIAAPKITFSSLGKHFFFPRNGVKTILDEKAIPDILNCSCPQCSQFFGKPIFTHPESIIKVLVDKKEGELKENGILLLAILVWMGPSFLIRLLFSNDAIPRSISQDTIAWTLRQRGKQVFTDQAKIEEFITAYTTVALQFDLPCFKWDQNCNFKDYSRRTVFPYINEKEPRDHGSPGTVVIKYRIHSDHMEKAFRENIEFQNKQASALLSVYVCTIRIYLTSTTAEC
jgi:hypothetical protein